MRLVLVALALCLFGCNTNKDTSLLGPEASREPSGIQARKYQIIYPSCMTGTPVTLDYASDFTGPIPAGHGRIGATGADFCAGYIGDRLAAERTAWYRGDPTSDDIRFGDPTDTNDLRGDPDSPERGDGDGTDVK